MNHLICRLIVVLLLVGVMCLTGAASAQNSSKQSPTPPDLRDLNSFFPFAVPATLEEWETRKSKLRQQLRMSLGLLPYPNRNQLNAVIHGTIDQGDYTIDKVYFESLPGFFVTGNLYRPKGLNSPAPGILSPHGHFPNGRFGCQSETAIDKDLSDAAELFRSNAKNKIQSRCANLAKMGCIVFVYDMIGYADSQQIGNDVAHRFNQQRPKMNAPGSWGLFSSQAELRLQNVMGLQTWNSIRALDFLESLPNVDKNRIGVTGASGGGTQTFILCALDDRPAASFPAVMVSTAMQGGCTCENCCYLRMDTGNVELAAMFAPKPMGLTAANDWTKEMDTKGFPELKQLYQLYQKPDNVQLTSRTELGHNYNQISREAMYRWFKKHLNFPGTPIEKEIAFLDSKQLTVYDANHPRPPGGAHFERNLLVAMDSPKEKLASYGREKLIEGILASAEHRLPLETQYETKNRHKLSRHIQSDFGNIVRSLPKDFVQTTIKRRESGRYMSLLIENVMNSATKKLGTATQLPPTTLSIDGNETPTIQFDLKFQNVQSASLIRELGPKHQQKVLIVSNDGIGVLASDHKHAPIVRALSENYSIRTFDNGWIRPVDKTSSRRVNNPREVLAYTMGYNPPQIALRASSWIAATRADSAGEPLSDRSIFVVSLDQSMTELALNLKQLSENSEVAGFVIDTNGYRFRSIQSIRDPDLLPGALKYGDLVEMLSLAAPKPMLLMGEDDRSAAPVRRAYQRKQALNNLTIIGPEQTPIQYSDIIRDWMKNYPQQVASDK